ncbi:MAG TPA: hypothetical protein VFF03_03370 [Rhodocyclaceae bacterium]|nr:hypothetical protein [Rhodocyclaceae bacterium]
MENRPLSLVACLILAAGCFALPALAADLAPSPEQRADWDRRLEEAKAQQQQGAARQKQAKEAYNARKKECFKKFRVTGCQHEAKQDYVQATNEGRRIANEGKAREREVKREELADKDARRLAREPQRQAELQSREAEVRAERAQDDSARAAKLAEKEEKARIGAERRAAAEERLRKKQEKHARKVAEKMEKARLDNPEAGR